MPTRNSRKDYAPDTYYHTYSRGANKQNIFLDEQDYAVFLSYLQRYLSPSLNKKNNRQAAKSFANDLSLLCYCLMPNHIHLLIYQHNDSRALPSMLQRIFTSYSMYFNKKYDRVGPLFQGRYLASRIDNDAYLHHVSRYIHRNPARWRTYTYSSLRYYTGDTQSDWIKPDRILELFNNEPRRYMDFIASMDEDDEEAAAYYLAHE